MRCYNKSCEKWNGVICKTPCENRMGAKRTAIAHNCWEESKTLRVYKAGTNSYGIIIPSRIIKKYNIKENYIAEIVEENDVTKIIFK